MYYLLHLNMSRYVIMLMQSMKYTNVVFIVVFFAVVFITGFAVYRGLGPGNSKYSAVSASPAVDEKINNQATNLSQSIEVEGGMFYFKPNEIKVKVGEKVSITFKNVEGVHDFVIDELNVRTNKIQAGETETVEFTPEIPGSYEFYCSVGNHRAMGMKGTLIVE